MLTEGVTGGPDGVTSVTGDSPGVTGGGGAGDAGDGGGLDLGATQEQQQALELLRWAAVCERTCWE